MNAVVLGAGVNLTGQGDVNVLAVGANVNRVRHEM